MKNPPQLRDYQETGAGFLASRPRAVLADEMRLGKTVQAIAAADRVGAKKIIVVCPAVVRPQWAREIEKFSAVDRTSQIVVEAKGFKITADVVIVSYDLLTRPAVLKPLMAFSADVIIFDEAQFLRNHLAKRTIASLGHACTGKNALAGSSKRVWFLSGTLAPNTVLDLYPFMRFCGAFNASHVHFQRQFTVGYQGEHGYVVTRNQNVSDLRRRLERIQLRRTRHQVLKDLPPVSVVDLVVEPSESPFADEFILSELPAIDAMLSEEVEHFIEHGQFKHPINVSALRRKVGMMKVLPVCQLIDEELKNDPSLKVLVFGIHTVPLKFIRAYLAPKHGAKLIFGGTQERRRQGYIDEFQTAPTCRVLVGQIASLGLGTTLTAASSVWVFEPSWLPDDNAQAIARAIGKFPIMARMVSLAGTVDEVVTRRLTARAQMLDEIRG